MLKFYPNVGRHAQIEGSKKSHAAFPSLLALPTKARILCLDSL